MSAYACEPHRGSEPGVGWNWAVQAALHGHEVHVVTRANNRAAIIAETDKRPIPGLNFHYLDLPKPFLWMKRRLGYQGLVLYYYLWQLALAVEAKRLHRSWRFDLAHHVTFVNDWVHSGLSVLRIPFIWGPVGGSTHQWPEQIEQKLPAYALRHEKLRRWGILALRRFDPLRHLTGMRASLILTYTEEALAGLKPRELPRAYSVTHIGITPTNSRPTAKVPPNSKTLRITTGGRLVHWKGFDLLIEGMGQYMRTDEKPVELVITGNGPFRSHLERLTYKVEVADSVRFVGRLPTRADVEDLLLSSHLYALPTLRDGPPVGILEAMALGLPILCLDLGATGELVPNGGGIKIPVVSRSQVVDQIAEAIRVAAHEPNALRQRGLVAQSHTIAVHDWNRIGAEIDRIYRDVGTPHTSST